MNTSISKVRVPVAVSGKSKHDLPSYHITTSDFFQLLPAHYKELVPGETYKVPSVWFTRLSPLSVPTFGNIMQKIHVFFVPYRCIMRNWPQFKVDTFGYGTSEKSSGLVNKPPYFRASSLYNAIVTDSNLCVSGTSTNYDFMDSSSTPATYYKLTINGVRAVTLLESLGYRFFKTKLDTEEMNALALLAMARVWYDWFSASAYQDSAYCQFLQGLFDETSLQGVELQYSDLNALIKGMLYVNYSDDYFTLAWDNPTSPNNFLSSSYTIMDISSVHNGSLSPSASIVANDAADPTPTVYGVQGSSINVTHLTKYSLEALESLSNYLKRFQLVGSRVADRYLAEFGVALDNAQLNRSLHLKTCESVIKIGDVMSHAGTSDNALGDYAGQGQVRGEDVFEFQTNEWGMFIVTSSLIPDYGYWQGIDRHNLHMDRLDWWTPEYDQLAVQSIAKAELYISDDVYWAPNGEYMTSFGYTPRYAEYKFSRNYVTGMYRFPKWDVGGSSWHLNRTFTEGSFGGTPTNMVHSLAFILAHNQVAISNSQQFDRIFDYVADSYDHFNQVFFFGGASYSPVLSIFDSFDFHEEEDNKKITMPANGSKLN